MDRTSRMECRDVAEAYRALADYREYLIANSGWWPSVRDGWRAADVSEYGHMAPQ
jgi:hypothetical protein